MKNLDPNTEPGLIWPEPPWATTIHDMKDRLNISIPDNEPGKSMKEQWAKEHKAYIEKYHRDGSRFNLYTDRSLLFDQGVWKTGFGYVAYHCSKVILRGNGSTGSRVEVYDTEMEGLAQGLENLVAWLDSHHPANLPLSLSIFSDNTGALQCITAISPGYDIDQTLHFQELLFKTINKQPNSNIVIKWDPGHYGIKGNELADKLAKEGTSLPSVYPHAASVAFIGNVNKQQL